MMDNLNTHKLPELYEAFAPCQETGGHHTPRHGSWTDMAETGINIPARQCPGRRI